MAFQALFEEAVDSYQTPTEETPTPEPPTLFETHMQSYVQGENGATFTPSVSEGMLSWQNNKDLENPPAASIKGDKGETGAKGPQGEVGPQGVQGEVGPQGVQGETGPQGAQGEMGPTIPVMVDGVSRDEDGSVDLCAVRYVGQTLNDVQKAMAQENIDVPSMALWQELENASKPNYEGVDLTVRFASEIASFDNAWAWIQNRIQTGNFNRIYIGDYLPFEANENTYHAQVAGINTYQKTPPHIDFVCKEYWPVMVPMNLVRYNNGISTVQAVPWCTCNAYAYVNSLQMDVPNGTTFEEGTSSPPLTSVNYTEDGIWYHLPSQLKAVIVEKSMYFPTRHSVNAPIVECTKWMMSSLGKLWIPSEVELTGMAHWGGNGFASTTFVPYPLFACNQNRNKGLYYWTCSPMDGSLDSFVAMSGLRATNHGHANSNYALLICFRIA